MTRNTRWPSLGELWTFLGVALPALAALLVPMPAVDLAYQLRAGADILTQASIPNVDTWTFTIAGTPWLDQQWGAQVLLAGTYQVAGWTGLAILRAALVALTFGLVLTAIRHAWSLASVRAGGSAIASSSRTATLIVLGSFVVAAPALALRPQLFAIFLFAATLLIVVQRAEHPRRLWLIPLIAIAWANLHGSFPLVVVLVALAWVDEVALLREPTPPGQPERRLPQRLLGSTGLALIGAISAIATLVTPFGIDAWRYIENLARNPAITNEVSEWRPPSLFDPAGLVFYISLAIVIGVIAFRLRGGGHRPPARLLTPIITVAVFAVLAIVTGRGLAWWALIAPVAMVKLQPGLRLQDVKLSGLPTLRARTAREASVTEGRRSPLNALVVVVLFVAAIALLPLWRPLGLAGVPAAVLSDAPQGVAATIRNLSMSPTRPVGTVHVWAPQVWGSWLEFAAPNAKVATDSRIELFPPEIWSHAELIAQVKGSWQAIVDQYAVNVIVIDAHDLAWRVRLQGEPDWELAHSDDDAYVWVRIPK